MKIARFFSLIFGILGTVLMVGSIGLCLFSLNKEAKLEEVPTGAQAAAQTMMDALDSGDFSAASRLMYGQPDLGAEGVPEGQMASMLWTAFTGSISYDWEGGYYLSGGRICRDASVTALDISTVTSSLRQRSHALLTARVETAADMTELYDESNNFREELVAEVMEQALIQALAEDAQTVTRSVTLQLVSRDGQWWTVPDGALMQLLTGGVA